MKKIRLLMLVLMLVGGFYIFDGTTTKTYGCAEDAACPPNAPRDNGCKCCSDNHCVSGYCGTNDKCADRPGGPVIVLEES